MNTKIFSSALSQKTKSLEAIKDLASKVKEDLKGNPCDLAILFISVGYKDQSSKKLIQAFVDLVHPLNLIACNSCGVVGDEKEVEMKPAISVLAMHLPEVRLVPFSFSPRELDRLKDGPALIKNLDLYPTDKPNFICLADPYTCDVNKILELFNEGYEGCPVVGGLASANVLGAPNWLSLQGEIYKDGLVGLALLGEIEFETVVSQGCRPIGDPFIVTKCEENVMLQIAGKPTLEVLSRVFSKLPEAERELAKQSLFVGMVMDENKANYQRGDFLIRNIMGADQKTGSLIVGENLKIGQTIQFQLRDSKTSEEDLEAMLDRLSGEKKKQTRGGMLISCCGRGKGLFKEEDHDVQMIQSIGGPMPLTGFFANGEFGPIDETNYIHGYTSSLTVIR